MCDFPTAHIERSWPCYGATKYEYGLCFLKHLNLKISQSSTRANHGVYRLTMGGAAHRQGCCDVGTARPGGGRGYIPTRPPAVMRACALLLTPNLAHWLMALDAEALSPFFTFVCLGTAAWEVSASRPRLLEYPGEPAYPSGSPFDFSQCRTAAPHCGHTRRLCSAALGSRLCMRGPGMITPRLRAGLAPALLFFGVYQLQTTQPLSG
jgi:hypothetical protein